MAARLTTYVVVGIVAATLIAGLMVGAQRDDNDGPVDLIVFNGKVYTADASGSMAEAVAVRGNQILRVGSNREINRLRRPQTVVVDALGGAVLPGFNDASARFIDAGVALDAVDLSDATTLEEIQALIRTWAEGHPERPWIIGRGWTINASGPSPTRQTLDEAVEDRPVYLLSLDGEAAWLNTNALQKAGITSHTLAPAEGTILKDAHGLPSGVLKGTAIALAARVVPRVTREDRARGLRTAIREAHRNGITSVQDAIVRPDDFMVYDEARRAGDLNIRVYSSISVDGIPEAEAFARLESLSRQYPDDPIFKMGGARITLDGSVESLEASMLQPYEGKEDDDGAGKVGIDVDAFNRFVRLLDARGWQVTAESSGDRAVRMALNAFEHAARSNPEPERGRRHRLDGVELVDAIDVPRFGRLGAIATVEPLHAVPTNERMDAWTLAVGPERASRAWPSGSIVSARGKLAFGSGLPASTLDPMGSIHAAVTRTTVEGTPDGGWAPAERVSRKRAINALTAVPAFASFDEQRKGSLTPGMLADLVVLSDDIFDIPDAQLATTTVAVTIFDGKIVYRRNSKSTN
jgi:predicted amidohydrolase YtcJ